ncbi:MAG: hypothetical protein KA375_09525 [Vitreoscilla sp.]|nr:hypothetical protein [Vitreoscilla sp.]MBP6674757.1 hypothetical protein [Vitreoscilla sp.]
MVPWLWFWAPQLHLPFSGSVAQNIEPNTTWFSDLIQPQAGNASIEARAFGVASYGKQLGQITEVLLALTEGGKLDSGAAALSLQSLKEIKQAIDAIKDEEHAVANQRLVQQVSAARQHGGPRYALLAAQLRRELDQTHLD